MKKVLIIGSGTSANALANALRKLKDVGLSFRLSEEEVVDVTDKMKDLVDKMKKPIKVEPYVHRDQHKPQRVMTSLIKQHNTPRTKRINQRAPHRHQRK